MRVLKFLVVVMGILLVIGTIVLVFAISKKMNAPHVPEAAAPVLPQGAKIVQMTVSDGTLALWLKHEGQDQVVLISTKDGKIIGSF